MSDPVQSKSISHFALRAPGRTDRSDLCVGCGAGSVRRRSPVFTSPPNDVFTAGLPANKRPPYVQRARTPLTTADSIAITCRRLTNGPASVRADNGEFAANESYPAQNVPRAAPGRPARSRARRRRQEAMRPGRGPGGVRAGRWRARLMVVAPLQRRRSAGHVPTVLSWTVQHHNSVVPAAH